MRGSLLLASSSIALVGVAHTQTITPGNGVLVDAAGHVWTIAESGSIMEGADYTPGGGGTSALTIVNGTVYGEDSHGRGWFALSGAGQYWSASPPPQPAAANSWPVAVSNAAAQSAAPTASPSLLTAPKAAVAATNCGTTSSDYFGILPLQEGSPGRIIAPDGSVFVPRGIGIMEGQEPSVQTLQAHFPGITFVRYAMYSYPAPVTIASWVNAMTQAGIVVEIENHNNGTGANWGGGQGSVFTGQQLTTELSWYADMASYFKGNGRVWFGTNNEPPGPAGLSQWHRATYDAIRTTDNQTVIMIDPAGGYDASGLDASAYAQMSNVAWDIHYYGWGPHYSTDAGTVKATLSQWIKNAQAIESAGGVVMPVIIGEYGDSTNGITIDQNGMMVVQTVNEAVARGEAAGSAAWVWAPPQPGDGLVHSSAGGLTAPYGTTVAAHIQQAIQTINVCTMPSGQQIAQTTARSVAATVLSDPAAQGGQDAPAAAVQPPATASQAITDLAPTVQTSDIAAQQALTDSQMHEQQLQARIQYLQSLAAAGQAMPSSAGQVGQ